MKEYEVMVGVESDKKNKRFEPGDVVTDKDFPKYVISTWVERGILLPMQNEPEEVDDGGDA